GNQFAWSLKGYSDREFAKVDYNKKAELTMVLKKLQKKGYAVAEVGDSVNYSVPGSKTRRGRGGKGVVQTLDTDCNQAD
ncbi:hypothetical protein ACFVWC_29555, partial [Bacillus mycoides]